jgi:hypothetical protein
VQWLALALGVAFMGFMVWSYIYPNNPAEKPVTIGHQQYTVSPGTVDPLIHDEAASPLENKLHQTHPEFQIAVDIPTGLSWPTTQPSQETLASAWNSWPYDVSKVTPGPGQIKVDPRQLVQSLPAVPALNYVDNEPLRTVLAVGDATSGVKAHQDSDSVTTFWSLPINDLDTAFKNTFGNKLPDAAQALTFVQVVVVRQEQNPDGSWGPDVIVSRPANYVAPPFAYPPPAGQEARQQLAQYKIWMQSNQPEIANPIFPEIAIPNRGDLQWQPLEQWIPYRANQAAAAAQAELTTPAAPAAPGAAAPAAGGGAFNPVGPLQKAGIATPAPGGDNGVFGTAPTAGATSAPPAEGGASAPAPAVIIPPIPKLQPVPATSASPSTLAAGGDIGVYFIDMTVQPGSTYRYKARYTLYNPLYDQVNRAAQPAMSDQFGLDSPDSAWSATIAVPSRTRFWCSAKQPGGRGRLMDQVGITVYAWHDGQWSSKDYTPVPGDEIGADEGASGNFVTQWTLLDVKAIRPDSEARTALVVADSGGAAQRRDTQMDVESDEYKKFQRDFNLAKPPATPQANVQPAAPGAKPPTSPPPQQRQQPRPPQPQPVGAPPAGGDTFNP